MSGAGFPFSSSTAEPAKSKKMEERKGRGEERRTCVSEPELRTLSLRHGSRENAGWIFVPAQEDAVVVVANKPSSFHPGTIIHPRAPPEPPLFIFFPACIHPGAWVRGKRHRPSHDILAFGLRYVGKKNRWTCLFPGRKEWGEGSREVFVEGDRVCG